MPPFDMVGRFKNSSEVVKYVCSFEPHDHATRGAGYDPICPFPHAPKGWVMGPDGPNATEVVFGDCSWYQAQGSKRYGMICLVHVIISLYSFVMFIRWLQQTNANKPKPMKYFWKFTSTPNVTEQLIILGIIMSFFDIILAADITNAGGWIPLWLGDVAMGVQFSCGAYLIPLLVTSWVTIIDGGEPSGGSLGVAKVWQNTTPRTHPNPNTTLEPHTHPDPYPLPDPTLSLILPLLAP